MKTRVFGKSGVSVSEVGLGTWQLGGADWGDVDEGRALKILHDAADRGITFFDTSDVYGPEISERFIGKFLKERKEDIFTATKIGRFPNPGWPENFSAKTMRTHTENSIKRLGVEALDLTQLHCIPTDVMADGAVFDILRDLKKEGKIKNFGASVESMDEALICLKQNGLASLQIIFNIFRQKPIEALFEKAVEKNVAIIARVPLASGLLSGKLKKETQFADNDHRKFNRDGQLFNVGETFAGLPYELGVDLADELRSILPGGMTMAQAALRWILDFDAVSVVIPGASRPEQVESNAAVSELPSLSPEVHEKLKTFYGEKVKKNIRGPY